MTTPSEGAPAVDTHTSAQPQPSKPETPPQDDRVVLRTAPSGIPTYLRVPSADGEDEIVISPLGTPVDPGAVDSIMQAAEAVGIRVEEVNPAASSGSDTTEAGQ